MKRLILVVAFLMTLTACEENIKWGIDKCESKVLFSQCLKDLPAGPQATQYNDWAEVVEQCGIQARQLSFRADKNVIKPECLGR